VDFHASCVVQEIFCGGDYGLVATTMRIVVDAHATWPMDSGKQNDSVLQEANDFRFAPGRGAMPWFSFACWWVAFFSRARGKLE
jgi:hypothetical protein